MRPSLRAVPIGVALAMCGLVLTTATPSGPSGLSGLSGLAAPQGASSGVVPLGALASPTPGGSASPANTPSARGNTVPVRQSDPDRTKVNQQITELRDSALVPPSIDVDPDGHLRSVTQAPGSPMKLPLGSASGSTPTQQARALANSFVGRYGQAFGVTAGTSARAVRTDSVPGGARMVRFQQFAGSVPVLGGTIVVTVGDAGIIAANGATPDSQAASTRAKVPADTAASTAVSATAARFGLSTNTLSAGTPQLWMYDPRMIGAPGRSGLRPTWQIDVGMRIAQGIAEPVSRVLVDALDGTISLLISTQETARNRRVCDLKKKVVDTNNPATYACTGGALATVRSEGQGATGIADVDRAYDYAGATYNFYKNNLGRDSINGKGMPIVSTARVCDTYYQQFGLCFDNAFWDGTQMVYGDGFASADDVVGHELTHGVTQYTSQLYYYGQPGAINESVSDIMSEFIDQTDGLGSDSPSDAWQLGEDLSIGAIRNMANPGQYGQPDLMSGYVVTSDDNAGVHTNSGIGNKTAYLIAAGTNYFNGQTIRGIGITKSIQLWYRVMFLLSAGSGYADLGRALSSGCRQLVGYRGITIDDCFQVDKATLATQLKYADPDHTGDCDNNAPSTTIWSDTMEQGSAAWSFSPSWELIPAPDASVSWAHSGVSAAYGWTDTIDAPTVSTATMTLRYPITVPAAASTQHIVQLSFEHLVLSEPASGNSRYQLQYAIGNSTTWQSFPQSAYRVSGEVVPNPSTGSFPYSADPAYRQVHVDLRQFAGQQIRIRFMMSAGAQDILSWLVDDVRFYQCQPGVPGAPRDLSAVRSGTTAQVNWTASEYDPEGVDHYEIKVLPAVAGAPTTVPASNSSLVLSGLDPEVNYQVTMRAVNTSGIAGQWVITKVLANPNVDCRTAVPQIDPATGRRRLPWPCRVTAPNRR